MTSRRGFLVATAGGFVLGQLSPGHREAAGRIVAASHARGHLLRDGGDLGAPRDAGKADVVVVGAGVSGLSSAWRLAALGLDVVLLELESFLGGTSAWGDEGGLPHPFGAHYLPAPNLEARPALRLLEQMGVLVSWDAAGRPRFDPRALCHAPEDRLFYRGAWHLGLVPHDALDPVEDEQLKRFLERVESLTEQRGADGRYVFHIPLAESSRDPEWLALDELTMSEWLDREGFDSAFVRWYVRYATLDDFGADPDDVSAWAGLHYFAARKLRTPELEGSHFLVWPEGNGRLVKALRERSAARVIQDALALDVAPEGSGVRVTYLDAARGETARLTAKAAVLAVPGFIAARLASRAPRAPWVRKSSPWLVANLHVDRGLEPDHAWDSVLYDAEGLGYVDASHQLTPPRDKTVLTYFRAYGERDVAARRRALMERSWESLARDVFADLAPAHPDLAKRTSRVDVAVWGHAMPRPARGFLGDEPFRAPVMLDERVAWASVDQPGMALFEEAQRAGVVAAEHVARAIGVEPGESWI